VARLQVKGTLAVASRVVVKEVLLAVARVVEVMVVVEQKMTFAIKAGANQDSLRVEKDVREIVIFAVCTYSICSKKLNMEMSLFYERP
jgi:hypothetical protein